LLFSAFCLVFTTWERKAIHLFFTPINNPVLSQYVIRKIAVAKDGKLWLSSDKGVISFDGNEALFFGRGEGGNVAMDNQSISRTSFDEAGNLYCVVMWGKIFYLNTKTGKVDYVNIHVTSEDSAHFNKLYPYTEVLPDNEYLWGATPQYGLYWV
jgi:ligand-binding sensor domain-containing protein